MNFVNKKKLLCQTQLLQRNHYLYKVILIKPDERYGYIRNSACNPDSGQCEQKQCLWE